MIQRTQQSIHIKSSVYPFMMQGPIKHNDTCPRTGIIGNHRSTKSKCERAKLPEQKAKKNDF